MSEDRNAESRSRLAIIDRAASPAGGPGEVWAGSAEMGRGPRLRVRTIERIALVRFEDAAMLVTESDVRAVGEQLDRLVEGGHTRLLLNLAGVRVPVERRAGRPRPSPGAARRVGREPPALRAGPAAAGHAADHAPGPRPRRLLRRGGGAGPDPAMMECPGRHQVRVGPLPGAPVRAAGRFVQRTQSPLVGSQQCLPVTGCGLEVTATRPWNQSPSI